MSDVNLFALGCCVTFIAAAGAYVYLRECFSAQEKAVEPERLRAEADRQVRDVG